jgi:hypothetical protein
MLFTPIAFVWNLFWSMAASIFGLIWWVIQQIWLVKFIWIVLMTAANFILMFIIYYSLRRDYTLKNSLGFFLIFAVLVVGTLLFNKFLVD